MAIVAILSQNKTKVNPFFIFILVFLRYIIQKKGNLSKCDIKMQLSKAGINYFLHTEHTCSEYPRMLFRNHFRPMPC